MQCHHPRKQSLQAAASAQVLQCLFFMYATLNLFLRQLQHLPHLFRMLLGNNTSNTFTIHLLGSFAVFHYFRTQGHIESIDYRYTMCHVLLNFLKAQPESQPNDIVLNFSNHSRSCLTPQQTELFTLCSKKWRS